MFGDISKKKERARLNFHSQGVNHFIGVLNNKKKCAAPQFKRIKSTYCVKCDDSVIPILQIQYRLFYLFTRENSR